LLGLLDPLGPVALIGSMTMAIVTVHWGKPIWSTAGGGELPLTNIAVAVALILTGPGGISLDAALGSALPRWVALPALVIVFVVIAVGLTGRGTPQPAAAGASD
jgi:putative oxidoreductase